jgi:hypothetical protein
VYPFPRPRGRKQRTVAPPFNAPPSNPNGFFFFLLLHLVVPHSTVPLAMMNYIFSLGKVVMMNSIYAAKAKEKGQISKPVLLF